MKTSTSYELELHHARYIDDSLKSLTMPAIDLSVPTLGETMLINASKVPQTRPLVVEVIDPYQQLTVSRADMNIDTRAAMPIQIVEADERSRNFGRDLFGTAVNSLTYSRVGTYTWDVDVDPENITDTHMFREFTGILFNFARMKQTRMQDNV